MVESRCGILCEECKFKLQEKCKGCLNITRPFWSENCPVKSCCEGKEHAHCGECADFPCELAIKFAYDAKEGDNGKRLEQCRCWIQ